MKAPKSSEALIERALRLQRAGQTKEAESLYRRVISLNPRNHRGLWSLGVLLFEAQRLEEAGRYFERAVSVEASPTYLTSLGQLYRQVGRLDLAAESFGRILEIDPEFPEARLNLGVTLAAARVYPEALALLEEAQRIGPEGPLLHVALAALRLRLHHFEQAEVHARRAVDLAPDVAATHRQLADCLDARGRKAEAIASYRRAVELNPTDSGAHSELIIAMLSIPECDARAHFNEARAWSIRHAEPLRRHWRPHENVKEPERRLRIGYVSPDFRAHPLQQFLVPLLQHHNQSSHDIFLYSSVHWPDAETEWYQAFTGKRFRDIHRLNDVQAAELIRTDQIDVLIDLALHSRGGRLRVFACKPAPVQMSWLGYAGTTGLAAIDYRITDPFLDPPGTDLGFYAERCLYLPETTWCYASLASELESGILPALGLGRVTFGCQNSFRKLHWGVIALWASVLRRVEGSRFFLYTEEQAREGVRRAFAREGVAPERIEFGGRVSRTEYLRRYQCIDIGLDTFPFSGATTTLDAAWMGVPVVTLRGDLALQRAGTCIATNLGFPEFVAKSEPLFVETAVALASDLPRLSRIRSSLRSRLESGPLGDATRFAGHVEALYRAAWRNYCATREDGTSG